MMELDENVKEPRLSEELEALRIESAGKSLTVREIEERLERRGIAVLVIMMSLPFVVPVLPGVSTPFGIAILIMGSRIALLREPWLPEFLRKREIGANVLEKILNGGVAIARKTERVVKPRMHFLEKSIWRRMTGLSIMSGGIFLALPLPIPFSNTVPAVSIFLLALGMMERDGLVIIVGHVLAVLAWVALAGLVFLGGMGVDGLMEFTR